MKLRLFSVVAAILLLTTAQPLTAATMHLEVSGNGEQSESSIDVQTESKTEVEQSNQSEVSNEIETESETGSNQVDANQGDVEVETGDVQEEIEVVNHVGGNQVDTSDCSNCGSDSDSGNQVDVKVKNNGSDSDNQVSHHSSEQTEVKQSNTNNVTTKINSTANTGKNEIKNNNGDVDLKTGDIKAKTNQVTVMGHNVVNIQSAPQETEVEVSNNGSGSNNHVEINYKSQPKIVQTNNNQLWFELKNNWNTGGNLVAGNLGSVKITTGSISSEISSINQIGGNQVSIGCPECQNDDPSDPDDPEDPSDPGDQDSDNGNGNGDNGSSNGNGSDNNNDSGHASTAVGGPNGEVLGSMLPATGGVLAPLMLLQAGTFLSGVLLRLRRRLWSLLNTDLSLVVIIRA